MPIFCPTCHQSLNEYGQCWNIQCSSFNFRSPNEYGQCWNISPPKRLRQLLLPFEPVTVPWNGKNTLVARTQVSCRPLRLYFPHDMAHTIRVADIVIGKRSLIASVGTITGSAFCERRNPAKADRLVDWPALSPSEQIAVTVMNPLGANQNVEAYMTVMANE